MKNKMITFLDKPNGIWAAYMNLRLFLQNCVSSVTHLRTITVVPNKGNAYALKISMPSTRHG